MARIHTLLLILGFYSVKESYGEETCSYGIFGVNYCIDYCCPLDPSTCCYGYDTWGGGMIAVIVIGTLVPIIIIAAVVAYLCWRKRTTGTIFAAQPAGVTVVTTGNTPQMVTTGCPDQLAATIACNI